MNKFDHVTELFLSSLREVTERWSLGIFMAFKLVGSLWLFTMLIASIVVGSQWFILTYGAGCFVFTLLVTTFAITVITSVFKK